MVTAVETRERIEIRPITLQELGEMIGLPIVVRPWWGSVRRWSVHWLMRVEYYPPGVIEEMQQAVKETERKVRLTWECPAQGRNQKKRPEVQNGVIVLWEGLCRFRPPYRTRHGDQHVHAQTTEVKSVAHHAMLITIGLSGSEAQFLLGVDGGTPYVIQVTRRLQTVKEAFEWLMPKIVREAIAQGLDVKRQGDWFFIPRDRPPASYGYCGRVYGSRPELKTNILYHGAALIFNGSQTRHHGGIVVYQTIQGVNGPAPLVKGNVKAPDHETLHLHGWHIGVRNRSHPWRNASQPRARFDD